MMLSQMAIKALQYRSVTNRGVGRKPTPISSSTKQAGTVDTNMAARKLYWGSGSLPCWRALIAIEEKGLEYESKLLEFSKKEHKGADVVALNPRGQLPTFQDGDSVVNESSAIIFYLEAAYPEPALVPKDIPGKAKTYQRFFEALTFTEKGRPVILMKMSQKDKTDEGQIEFQKKLEALKDELTIWEKHLEGGLLAAGSEFTIADIVLGAGAQQLVRFGATLASYPNIKAYTEKMKERPSIAKTVPPHWKGTEGKDWFSML